MQGMHEQVCHIYGSHVKNREAGEQAADHRQDNYKSAIPKHTLKNHFKNFHHIPGFSTMQLTRIRTHLIASDKLSMGFAGKEFLQCDISALFELFSARRKPLLQRITGLLAGQRPAIQNKQVQQFPGADMVAITHQ